jgi:class 3 adenylate cyclase
MSDAKGNPEAAIKKPVRESTPVAETLSASKDTVVSRGTPTTEELKALAGRSIRLEPPRRDFASQFSVQATARNKNPFLSSLNLFEPSGFYSGGFGDLIAGNKGPVVLMEGEAAQKGRELNEKIAALRTDIEKKAEELRSAKVGAAEAERAKADIQSRYDELQERERFSFLLSRVNSAARVKLLTSDVFQKQFNDGSPCAAFVMSVDIRRSTDLMLKAKSGQMFAQFITTLCRELEAIIKDSYGVFDKFTGDGVLAFFPDFFSGIDAGYYCIHAAERCHKAFELRYREFRSSFNSVLTDVGLGIGVDYGPAHLFQIAGGMSIVGAPVVYACRMSGAPPGVTLLNQQGYERISERVGSYCFFKETNLEIKHEGRVLAYEVSLNSKEFKPTTPDWVDSSTAVAAASNDERK